MEMEQIYCYAPSHMALSTKHSLPSNLPVWLLPSLLQTHEFLQSNIQKMLKNAQEPSSGT